MTDPFWLAMAILSFIWSVFFASLGSPLGLLLGTILMLVTVDYLKIAEECWNEEG